MNLDGTDNSNYMDSSLPIAPLPTAASMTIPASTSTTILTRWQSTESRTAAWVRDGHHVSVSYDGVHVEPVNDSTVFSTKITCGLQPGIAVHGHDGDSVAMSVVTVRQHESDCLPTDPPLLQTLDGVLAELHAPPSPDDLSA